jgi:hypothetical protein
MTAPEVGREMRHVNEIDLTGTVVAEEDTGEYLRDGKVRLSFPYVGARWVDLCDWQVTR